MDVISVSWISKLTQRIYSSPSQLPSLPKKFCLHSQRVFHDILQLFACTATIHSVMATAAKEQQKKFIRFLWRWKKFSFSIFLLFARDRRLSSSSSILITGIPWEKTTSYYIEFEGIGVIRCIYFWCVHLDIFSYKVYEQFAFSCKYDEGSSLKIMWPGPQLWLA